MTSAGNYATSRFGWDTNHNQWIGAMYNTGHDIGYSHMPWTSHQGQISEWQIQQQLPQSLPMGYMPPMATVGPFCCCNSCNMMATQNHLRTIRENQRAMNYNVLLPRNPTPASHTTSYSLQQMRNRSLNPIIRAKIKQKQQCPIPAPVATQVGCLHLPGCHGSQSLYVYAGGQPQIDIGTNPDQSDVIRKLKREHAMRNQLENSISFKKHKRSKEKAKVVHKKKLKRLQKENHPYKRYRYNLWKTVNQERDDLRRGRQIMRKRRNGCNSRVSSPEECALWNCPKKLLRKGRLNRRYANSPGSIASVSIRQRSRSRTPIMRLRDTPLPLP